MKKTRVLSAAAIATLALILMSAAQSSATTLQWLANAAAIAAALATEMTGSLIMGFTNGAGIGVKGGLLCSIIMDGTVGPGGEDQITVVLSLADHEEITLTKPDFCVNVENCETLDEFAPVNLPWLSRLELMGTEVAPLFLDVIENGGKGNPGWEFTCNTVIGGFVETCTGTQSLNLTNDANENDVLGVFEKEVTLTCTNGGANSGYLETSAADEPLLIILTGGEALSVSYL